MKKAIRICLCLWMGFSAGAWGQTVYYVNSKASASNTGGTQAAPFNTVYKALNKANAGDTIKVAVGLYSVSTDHNKGGEGSIVVGAGITVRGGYASTPQGGVASAFADNPQDSVNQTILMGDSTCRIATVAGTLEKVTLRGGKAIGGNGGGAYVERGGVVRNCIVRGCVADFRPPKVGDILLKNGEYTDASNYDYDRDHGTGRDVTGIIIWVNSDPNIEKGERARAMSLKVFAEPMITLKSTTDQRTMINTYNKTYLSKLIQHEDIQSALDDTAGYMNTKKLYDGPYNTDKIGGYPLLDSIKQYGTGWYMPALGELMMIIAEYGILEGVYENIWEKVRDGNANLSTRRAKENVMRAYFGGTDLQMQSIASNSFSFDMVIIGMRSPVGLHSSTSSTDNNSFWKIEQMDEMMQPQDAGLTKMIKDGAAILSATDASGWSVFAVKKI